MSDVTPLPSVSPSGNPSADLVGDRINTLAALGHTQWMDPILAAHVASPAGGSTQNMATNADTMKLAMMTKPVEGSTFLSDPLLHAVETPIQKALSWAHNQYSHPPVVTSNINDVQASMQLKGYGIDPSTGQPLAKGNWTSSWTNELRRLANDQFNVPGFGNVSAMKIISPLLGEASLAKVAPQIVGWVENLGRAGRQIMADQAGSIMNDFGVGHGSSPDENQAANVARIENDLGGNTTTEQVMQQGMTRRSIADIGNMFQFASVIDGALGVSGVVKNVAGGMIKGSVPEDANVAQKVAALVKKTATEPQSMITRSLPEEFAATPRFGFVKWLYNAAPDAAKGAEGSGVLNLLNGVPGARNLLPLIAKLPTEGSKYAVLKNTIASLSRIPARQVTNALASKGFSTGIKSLAISEAEDKLSGGTPATYDLAHQAPYSGMLGQALNAISMSAGGNFMGNAGSVHAGNFIEGAISPLKDSLATAGVGDAFKQATGLSVKDMTEAFGQTEATNIYNEYLNKGAAYHYAETRLAQDVKDGKFEAGTDDYFKAGQKYAEDAYSKSHIANFARNSFIGQPNDMITHFMKENFDYLDKKATGEVLPEFKTGKAGKEKWIAARQKIAALRPDLETLLKEENKKFVFGSSAVTKAEDLRSERLAADMNKNPTFDNTANTKALYHLNDKVDDHAPETWMLSENGPYGSGIKATDDTNWVGRSKKNTYNLTHVSPSGAPAKILDLNKRGESNAIADAIKEVIGSNMGRSGDINKALDELGVMEPGDTPNTLRYLEKGAIPGKVAKGYEQLRKALKDDFNYTGQEVLDAYRTALTAAGKLNKQQVDQRIAAVTRDAVAKTESAGFKYMNKDGKTIHVIKPEAATAVKVRVDPALAKDNFMPSTIFHNNVVGRGQVGFVGPEYQTQQDIQNAVRKMASKYSKLGHDQEVANMFSTIEMEAKNNVAPEVAPHALQPMPIGGKEHEIWKQGQALAEKLGMSPKTVSLLEDPIQMMYALWKRSQTQASEASLLDNAPQEAHDAWEAVKAHGWRPALGTGIGHAYEKSIIPPHIVEDNNNAIRNAARGLGLGMDAIKDTNVFEVRRAQRAAAIDEWLLKTGTKLPFNMNGRDVLNLLAQGASKEGAKLGKVGHIFQDAMTIPKRALSVIYNRATPMTDKIFNEDPANAELLASGDETAIETARAEQRTKAQLAKSAETTVNNLSTASMRKILMQPINPDSKLGYELPLMDRATANTVITHILASDAKMKATYVGLGKVEDVLRASTAGIAKGAMSFMGKTALPAGESSARWGLFDATAGLGQNMIALRDKFRFDLNPLFGIRRMVKTNLKAALEGIPATANPYLSLMRTGRLQDAFDLTKRLIPEEFGSKMSGASELDGTLAKSDIFNFYNPLHSMMWQAQHLKEMGLSDEEIAGKLEKINGYGDRTAFEKSIATVFYPFSFNKTLYRNIGGYILDNTGKAAILNQALQVYQHGVKIDGHEFAFNKNNAIGNWLDKNFALITELKQLNALDHGVGLGQFGGINSQYINTILNMFAPQAITSDNASQATKLLKGLIPAWSELNALLVGYNPETGQNVWGQGTLPETAQAGWLKILNEAQHFANFVNSDIFKNPPRRAINYSNTTSDLGQVQQGLDFVTLAKSYLAPAISRKLTWAQALPAGTYIPRTIENLKINASSIEKYAGLLYPAYEAGGSTAAYELKNDALTKTMNRLDQSNDWNYANYQSFFDQATVVLNKINTTKDINTVAADTQKMRDKAVAIAMGTPTSKADPRFLGFYKKFYQSTFGPIEEVK